MWLNLLGMGVKTAAKLYQDKQKTKEALSGHTFLSRVLTPTTTHGLLNFFHFV